MSVTVFSNVTSEKEVILEIQEKTFPQKGKWASLKVAHFPFSPPVKNENGQNLF